jgi:hypothetical protein
VSGEKEMEEGEDMGARGIWCGAPTAAVHHNGLLLSPCNSRSCRLSLFSPVLQPPPLATSAKRRTGSRVTDYLRGHPGRGLAVPLEKVSGSALLLTVATHNAKEEEDQEHSSAG